MLGEIALFECVYCGGRHEDELPTVAEGLEFWPRCCGIVMMLVRILAVAGGLV